MTSLQLWLNKPKIDQRVQELERRIGQIAHGEAGQGNPELHEFLVTLVTQLFEAEAQAKKADKKEAQATAALLATVQAQRENTILETSTKATIDALVGEGFNAARTLRDHVKRWADMISAEYAGDTLRQAQLAKALAADRPTRVENCQQVYEVLKRKFEFTRKPIWDKKDLRGVTRRFAFFVPNHGPDAVRRPVLGCHTLEGSKPLRQFVDCKSDSAQILTRLHSCHECEGCRTLSDYRIELDEDGNASIPANTTCKNMEICGPVEAYQLVLPSAAVIQPLTRSYFANKGKALGLQVKVGDVIVVELTHENEKYMLGVVTKAHYKHSGEDIEVPYMGTIKARDDLVDVRKFEPMRGGSTVFKLCQQAEKHFPVFTDDTRKILAVDDLKKEEVRRGRSEHARSDDCHGFEYAAAYKLKSAVHAEILTLVNAEDPIEEVD